MSLLLSTVDSDIGNGILHITKSPTDEVAMESSITEDTLYHSSYYNAIQVQNIYSYTIPSTTVSTVYSSRYLQTVSKVSLTPLSDVTSMLQSPYVFFIYVYNSILNKSIFLQISGSDAYDSSGNYYTVSHASNMYFSFRYSSTGSTLDTYASLLELAALSTDGTVTPFITDHASTTVHFLQTNVSKSDLDSRYNLGLQEVSNDIDCSASDIKVNGVSVLTKPRLCFYPGTVNGLWMGGDTTPLLHNVGGALSDSSNIAILGSILSSTPSGVEMEPTSLKVSSSNGGTSYAVSTGVRQISRLKYTTTVTSAESGDVTVAWFTPRSASSSLCILATARLSTLYGTQISASLFPIISGIGTTRILNVVRMSEDHLAGYINVVNDNGVIKLNIYSNSFIMDIEFTAFEYFN